MEPMQGVALVLSVAAAVVLVVALRDIWRRGSFPGFEHGAVRVSAAGMKWIWGAALILAFIAGGPEVVSRTTTEGQAVDVVAFGADREDRPRVRHSAGWEIRVAAYRHSVMEDRLDGERSQRAERIALLAPVWLPLALLAYWLAVARQVRRGTGRPPFGDPAFPDHHETP